MKQSPLILVVVLAAAARVPASDKRPPAGAAGYSLVPSPAARGEPVQDGEWTVTIERLVLRVSIHSSGGGGDGQDATILDATKPTDVFTSGLRVGQQRIFPSVSGRYISSFLPDDPAAVLGVDDPELVRMFENPGPPKTFDHDPNETTTSYSGPSVFLVVRGERPGASPVVLEVASRGSPSDASCVYRSEPAGSGYAFTEMTVNVRENDVVLLPADVLLKPIFGDDFPFAVVAGADANHDGHVDEGELVATPLAQTWPGLPAYCADTVFVALAGRVMSASLLVPR